MTSKEMMQIAEEAKHCPICGGRPLLHARLCVPKAKEIERKAICELVILRDALDLLNQKGDTLSPERQLFVTSKLNEIIGLIEGD